MKTLYLLRHAKAAPDSPLGDSGRPLAKRGRKAAKAMGAFLGTLKPAPALILCSPAARTRETLELLLPALHPSPAILYEEGLYLAEPGALLERIRKLPANMDCVLLVGHNPGLHELGGRLASDPGRLAEGFPTAALAMLQLTGTWADLHWHRAKLGLFQTAKDLIRDLDPDAD